MKQAIRNKLKQHPAIFDPLRKVYRSLFPARDPYQESKREIQARILDGLQGRSSVFFVQVGSNDGVQGDPLHELIGENESWRGIFIEPVGFLFNRLRSNYGNSSKYIFENKAIAQERGELAFYYVSKQAEAELGDRLPFWYDQLGSFDKNHILKHLDGALEPYIVSEAVQAVTIQDILDKHKVKELDLIHIDTEGYDYKVLSQCDFSRYRPKIVLYEHQHLSEEEKSMAQALLKESGYSCVEHGGDTLAVHTF